MELNYAYLAGLVDADGTVRIEKYDNSPILTVSNCDLELLQDIKTIFGGKIRGRTGSVNENHNTSYDWDVHGRKALSILSGILPYMKHRKKRLRAELLVTRYLKCTPRNGKYTEEQKFQKQRLYDDVMGIVMRGKGAY